MPKLRGKLTQIYFTDRQGSYMPYQVEEDEATRARALLGTRRVMRVRQGVYWVEADREGQYWKLDLADLDCDCPQVAMHRVKICKHLILCQWIEEAVSD